MPKNPFAPKDYNPQKLKRNAFDLSCQSFNTTEFGKLLPVYVQEVIPGDSFQIDGSVACRAMPTVFPLQTRIRASVSYFYVRNRCLYPEWEDFIFRTKEKTPPYLQLNNARAKQMVSTGSLGDSLGVPTTVGTSDMTPQVISFESPCMAILRSSPSVILSRNQIIDNINNSVPEYITSKVQSVTYSLSYAQYTYFFYSSNKISYNLPSNFRFTFNIKNVSNTISVSSTSEYFVCLVANNAVVYAEGINLTLTESLATQANNFSDTFFDKINSILQVHSYYQILFCKSRIDSNGSLQPVTNYSGEDIFFISNSPSAKQFVLGNQSFQARVDSITDATDDSVISNNPFVGTNPSIPLNALPFRAYTMICNYFFRNDLNNPYILNGEVQYNKFIPSYDGGADTNVYDFMYKNWEMDQFTSALQSPQFGTAPLVGITFSGADKAEFTFIGDDSKEYNATIGLESDGRLASIDSYSNDIPSGNLRRLMDMINYGISINDLRNVNSFQRFLENCQRKSLRYRDQLKSHLGVSVDYPDIDVPQYIGGYSSYLNVGQNTNVAQSPDAGLGDFNGTLGGTINSSHSIRCYCPEHGFIIGIYSLSPIPLYSQNIAKYLIKHDAFDYFQAEFSKIGFVPMHYNEVTPLQNLGTGQLPSDVFGYQRAWYDYMSNLDSSHGDFRTTLQQFTLSRTFEERPTLVEDFVRINPEHLNNIFVTNNIADRYNSNAKFLLNIYHKVTALRPIPRNGIAALE